MPPSSRAHASIKPSLWIASEPSGRCSPLPFERPERQIGDRSGGQAGAELVRQELAVVQLVHTFIPTWLFRLLSGYGWKNSRPNATAYSNGMLPFTFAALNGPGAAISSVAASTWPQTFHSSTPRTRPSRR